MSRQNDRCRVRIGDVGPRELYQRARRAPQVEERPSTERYRVEIVYAEPGFRIRNPHCPEEYHIEFSCAGAHSPEGALAMALGEWNFCAAYSRVGWHRVIKSITINC